MITFTTVTRPKATSVKVNERVNGKACDIFSPTLCK